MRGKKVLFGCVVDTSAPYTLYQAVSLAASIRWFGGKQANADIRVCYVCDGDLNTPVRGIVPSYWLDRLRRLGVDTIGVSRFHTAQDPCMVNKIQLLRFHDLKTWDSVVLLDCDIIMVQDPTEYVTKSILQARVEYSESVPHEVLVHVLRHFGFEVPEKTCRLVCGTPYIPFFNTAVTILPAGILKKLTERWVFYQLEMCNNPSIVLEKAPHETVFDRFSDLIGFTLAWLELRSEFEFGFLPHAMHLEPHFGDSSHPEKCWPPEEVLKVDPILIHYHGCTNPDTLEILEPGHPKAEASRRRVQQFNRKWAVSMLGT